MAHVVNRNKEGQMAYRGLLTSKEIENADAMLDELKKEIPRKEEELSKKYGEGKQVLMCYHLGKFLGKLLEKYGIAPSERKYFWKEINQFATRNKVRTRGRSDSLKLIFYEYCYSLSKFDLNVVKKLNYTQWRYVLEKDMHGEEKHIAMWLKKRKGKIRIDDWREFSKGMSYFLKIMDTSVFTDEEVMAIYDSVFAMMQYWRINIGKFKKEFPKSRKTETANRLVRSKRYIETCFALKKKRHAPLDEKIFVTAFRKAMG